ncbi:hypothetical protein BS47DRAFT_954052 [Hydnum rufescens UP504]|uniref:DUF7721 domain-containing protein n=1 Tax=Hydnum rufescens UP504 TaxID=1448309 RepID=A0A9P6AXC1_9AGAM|nr:hypothetical protein BS47DRAFT_954052 [Hydnum rufescens UP504]
MDGIFKLAKQGFQAYQEQQEQHPQQPQGNNQGGGQVHQTGGAELNSPDHGDGGKPATPDLDHSHILQTADNHSGSSGNSELFKQGLSFVQSQLSSGQAHHVDSDAELQKAQDAHKLASNGQPLSSSDIGSAAVFRAFQSFAGSGSSGGANSQSKIIGLAMSEASKLFDQSGGASDGGKKQDVINSAASTVTKLLLKHQVSSAIGGGNSGGLGSLLSLVRLLGTSQGSPLHADRLLSQAGKFT